MCHILDGETWVFSMLRAVYFVSDLKKDLMDD